MGVGAILFLCGTLSQPVTPVEPIQAARVLVGKASTKKFAFDWDGKSEGGEDHTTPISTVVFRFVDPGGTQPMIFQTVTLPSPVIVGTTKVPVKDVLVDVPPGDWDMQVRLRDEAGQESQLSLVTDLSRLTVTAKNPSAGKNVRVVDD